MPAFLSVEVHEHIPSDKVGQSVLTPAEIEDVIAFLKNLK
jgi:hypothetical protein